MNFLPNDESHQPKIPNLNGTWEALGISVPTITAYAYLCAQSLLQTIPSPADVVKEKLSGQAQTILYLGKRSAAFEIKVLPRGFRASERFLALHIHVTEDESLVFQDANDLQIAIQYLEAFRELCREGLCIHQLHGEFSLSHRGFQLAQSIHEQEVESWLAQAQNSNGI